MHRRSTHRFHVHAVSGSEVCVPQKEKARVGEEEVRVPGCVNVPDDVCARMHEKWKKGK